MATTRDRVVELISEHMGIPTDQINDDTNLVDDLGADSLDGLELTFELEEEFDVSIGDEDIERQRTVGQLVAYIESL